MVGIFENSFENRARNGTTNRHVTAHFNKQPELEDALYPHLPALTYAIFYVCAGHYQGIVYPNMHMCGSFGGTVANDKTL